jgi:ketosteroid isomerase-like protein
MPLVHLSAAPTEAQAKTIIDEFNAAGAAKDVDAVARLLSSDCLVLMTEPSAGSKRARFFTRESYLRLLTDRYSKTSASAVTRTVQSITISETGDVFLACDVDERSRIGHRSEWIRSYEYIVMKEVDKRLLVRSVVAELVFYVPDVPREPPEKQ